jgi:hypothetical protein
MQAWASPVLYCQRSMVEPSNLKLVPEQPATLACPMAYYHTERPHQGRENEVLVPCVAGKSGSPKPVHADDPIGEVRCRTRLGGLLKHYERRAA